MPFSRKSEGFDKKSGGYAQAFLGISSETFAIITPSQSNILKEKKS
jgi:hypothetical protein